MPRTSPSLTGVSPDPISLIRTVTDAGSSDLHILSIDPAAQGAGVGKRLLQSAVDLAVAENLPITLESTEREYRHREQVIIHDGPDALLPLSSRSSAVSLVRLPRFRRDSRCGARQRGQGALPEPHSGQTTLLISTAPCNSSGLWSSGLRRKVSSGKIQRACGNRVQISHLSVSLPLSHHHQRPSCHQTVRAWTADLRPAALYDLPPHVKPLPSNLVIQETILDRY